MKGQIMAEINSRLSALGILPTFGKLTDIAVMAEFVDASWGSGSKKIRYETLIYLDSTRKTAYMYEKTMESGSSREAGLGRRLSLQCGMTLYRKVKIFEYGLEGRSDEITMNLGIIPRTVREIVRKNGWQFRSTLKRSQATYPIAAGSGRLVPDPTARTSTMPD